MARKVNLSAKNSKMTNSVIVRHKKKFFAVLGVVAVILLIIASVVVVKEIKEKERIARIKSIVAQLDISTLNGTPEFDDDDDWDYDGVKNKDETSNGTNIQGEDTDGDGLPDGQELELGTDPLKDDTDGDGLLDGYEIMAGLNPRKSKTDDKTHDGQREVTITRSAGQVSLDIVGNANVANTTVEELDLFGISSNASIVSKAYDFYSDFEFKKATVTFELDTDKINSLGYSYDDLTILSFNSDTLKYTKVDSTVNKNSNTITADVSELSTFLVGVEGTVNEEATTRVAFLVDNSGSMYPEEMCSGSTENDVDFKRVDFANSLVSKFADGYQISVSKYTGTFTLLQEFTTDKDTVSTALDRIKNESETFNGTHTQTAIEQCVNQFVSNSDGKYRDIIVMLTDGESDETNGKSVSQLATLAKEKNIIILTVGLGRDIDRGWLAELATSTGGKYFTATDANALNEVYKQIVTTLNYDIVSYSDDADAVRGYALYNTGFIPETNGFSFKNFRTTTTDNMDYGMAVMARDWYLGNLKMSLSDLSPKEDSAKKVDAVGYSLSGTKIGNEYNSRTHLSQISIEALNSEYADVKEYMDYNSEGNTLKIQMSIKSVAEGKGWKAVEYPLTSTSLEWSKVEFLALDIAGSSSFKIGLGYSEDELEFYKALYRYNAMQWNDSEYEYNLTTNGEESFEKLTSQLALGVPVVTVIDGTHAVNAIGLIQDSSCHRKYVLQVYDSNYPGQTKEIYITKMLKGNFTVSNSKATYNGSEFAYVATYEGKQIGISFNDVEMK